MRFLNIHTYMSPYATAHAHPHGVRFTFNLSLKAASVWAHRPAESMLKRQANFFYYLKHWATQLACYFGLATTQALEGTHTLRRSVELLLRVILMSVFWKPTYERLFIASRVNTLVNLKIQSYGENYHWSVCLMRFLTFQSVPKSSSFTN